MSRRNVTTDFVVRFTELCVRVCGGVRQSHRVSSSPLTAAHSFLLFVGFTEPCVRVCGEVSFSHLFSTSPLTVLTAAAHSFLLFVGSPSLA